jgi:hypothetical protein
MPGQLDRGPLGRVLQTLGQVLLGLGTTVRGVVARILGRPPPRRSDRVRGAWPPFRDGVAALYTRVGDRLGTGGYLEPTELEALTPVLDTTLEASARIRTQARRALRRAPSDDYDEITALVLAAASVDAMLAADIAYLDPRLADARDREEDAPEEMRAYREATLTEADRLFARPGVAVAGGQAAGDPDALRKVVDGEVDRLVQLAEKPAHEVVRGVTALAIGSLLELIPIDPSEQIGRLLSGLPNSWPVRFLREHLLKLIELKPPEDAAEEVAEVTNGIDFAPALAAIAGVRVAKTRSAARINAAAAVSRDAEASLRTDLTALTTGYATQTHWIEKSARWVRRGGVPLSHLLAPTGPIVVGAVFMVGGSYLVYSLTDRLDARRLGIADRVVGVVRLVQQHIDA